MEVLLQCATHCHHYALFPPSLKVRRSQENPSRRWPIQLTYAFFFFFFFFFFTQTSTFLHVHRATPFLLGLSRPTRRPFFFARGCRDECISRLTSFFHRFRERTYRKGVAYPEPPAFSPDTSPSCSGSRPPDHFRQEGCLAANIQNSLSANGLLCKSSPSPRCLSVSDDYETRHMISPQEKEVLRVRRDRPFSFLLPSSLSPPLPFTPQQHISCGGSP